MRTSIHQSLKILFSATYLCLASCGGSSGSDSEGTPLPGTESNNNANSGATNLTSELGGIETVAMDSRMVYGVGGAFYLMPNPVIIFKDGTACEEINFFTDGLTASEHQAKNPDDWTKWRMEAGRRQMQNSKGEWENLSYTAEYPPLAKGTPLNFTMTNTSGGGNTAIGGGTIIGIQSTYEFSSGARFLQGKYVGASSTFAGSTTVVSSVPADQQGSYEVDGYILTLKYDNGTSRAISFVIDMTDPSVAWIDGSAYLNKDRD